MNGIQEPKSQTCPTGFMPRGFRFHPGGIFENSPTFQFQRWGTPGKKHLVPKGRSKARGLSAVPSGLDVFRSLVPNVETLGYSRMSLRDKSFYPFGDSS